MKTIGWNCVRSVGWAFLRGEPVWEPTCVPDLGSRPGVGYAINVLYQWSPSFGIAYKAAKEFLNLYNTLESSAARWGIVCTV